jgi:hypothetical protein
MFQLRVQDGGEGTSLTAQTAQNGPQHGGLCGTPVPGDYWALLDGPHRLYALTAVTGPANALAPVDSSHWTPASALYPLTAVTGPRRVHSHPLTAVTGPRRVHSYPLRAVTGPRRVHSHPLTAVTGLRRMHSRLLTAVTGPRRVHSYDRSAGPHSAGRRAAAIVSVVIPFRRDWFVYNPLSLMIPSDDI